MAQEQRIVSTHHNQRKPMHSNDDTAESKINKEEKKQSICGSGGKGIIDNFQIENMSLMTEISSPIQLTSDSGRKRVNNKSW